MIDGSNVREESIDFTREKATARIDDAVVNDPLLQSEMETFEAFTLHSCRPEQPGTNARHKQPELGRPSLRLFPASC